MKIKYFAVVFMVMVLFFLVACGPAKQVPAESDLTPEELNQLPTDLKSGNSKTALAGQAVKWDNCVDGDNSPDKKWNDKQQLLTKYTTTYSGGSKEDKCYTWYKGTAKEKTRLIEGICKKIGTTNKFNYWYADCDVAFGKGAKCVEGKCVTLGNVNLVLSNVKFMSNGVDVDKEEEALDFTMPVVVSFDVTNEGDTVDGVFQDEVQACKPSAESCKIVSGVTVQGFQAKQTTHHTPGTFMLTSSMIVDNKVKIRVVVDGDGQITETNENDNLFEMVLNVVNVPTTCTDTDAVSATLEDPDANKVKGITTGSWTLDYSKDHVLSLKVLGEKVYGSLPNPIYGSVEDYCDSQARLMEGYCSIFSQEDPTVVATGIHSLCADGTYCTEGTCKSCNADSCPSCFETDNGMTVDESGDISGLSAEGILINRHDECVNKGGKLVNPETVIIGASAVKEYSCKSNKVAFEEIDCEFGCNGGRCMDKEEAYSWNSTSGNVD